MVSVVGDNGSRISRGRGSAALFLIGGVGAAFVTEAIPLPDTRVLDPSIASNWVRATSFYFGMCATVVAAAIFLVGRLERSLVESHKV